MKPNGSLRELKLELATAHTDGHHGGAHISEGDMIRLRQVIEGLVPFDMPYPDHTACQREARIYLLSFLLERKVRTTKELSRGEAWRILAWLEGRHPYTNEPVDDPDATAAERQHEVVEWLRSAERRIKTRVINRPHRRQLKRSGGTWFTSAYQNTTLTSRRRASVTPPRKLG